MSGHERITDSEQFDLHNELYESFRQATIRDVCTSLDHEANPRSAVSWAHDLAELGLYEALPYLHTARGAVMSDLVEDR